MTEEQLTGVLREGLYVSSLQHGIRELHLLTELDEQTDDAGILLTLVDGSEFLITVVQTEAGAPYVEGRVY